MSSLHIFGIGSLVSRDSIAVPVRSIEAAECTGWQRAWNQRFLAQGAVWATLGIEPTKPDADPMLGALLRFDSSDEAYFRERESGYDWVEVSARAVDGRSTHAWTFAPSSLPKAPARIPLSYVLTVISGFDAVYDDGAQRFIDNTHGWEMGVVDDCMAPIYPRHPADIMAARARYFPLVAGAAEVELLLD